MRAKGYTEGWINQRLQTIEMRKELTDEWKERGITKDKDYAILTNEMTKAWSGLSVQEYKKLKGLKKENLRDNISKDIIGLFAKSKNGFFDLAHFAQL